MATNQIELDAPQLPCQQVTVYNDRAEVKRLVKQEIKAGTHEVIVRQLPESIDSGSIRVDGRGNATICQVQYNEKYVTPDEATVETKRKELQTKLEELEAEHHTLDDQLANVNKQGSVLEGIARQVSGDAPQTTDNTKKEGGNGSNSIALLDSLDKVNQFLDSWSQRYERTLLQRRELEKAIRKKQEEIQAVRRNMGHCRQGTTNREVNIMVESDEGGAIELDVSYVVYNAGWTPLYDLRVFTNDKENVVKISYEAQIRQETGEDWTDTQLALSTATPSVGGQVPEPRALRANFRRRPSIEPTPVPQRAMMMKAREAPTLFGSNATEAAPVAGFAFGLGGGGPPPPPPMMTRAEAVVSDNVITASFQIARATTIPSDNSQHKVNVAVFDLTPVFEHEAVPAKSTHAYLKAKVTNTSAYPILAGEASVFLNNNFVAKSTLKAVSPNEEFTCSLGVDRAVRIEYPAASKYHEDTGMISKYSLTTTEQHVRLHNSRADAVQLTLLEAIPTSGEEKIKVHLIKPDLKDTKKAHMKKDNILQCDVSLAAGAKEDLLIKWSLEHPKNDEVELTEA